jgi:hypothetical protein
MYTILTCFLLASGIANTISTTAAFTINPSSSSSSRALCTPTVLDATTPSTNHPSREMFLQQVFGAVGIAAVGGSVNPLVAVAAEEQPVKLPSGTSYVVVKSGDGPQPSVGELAGIRFRAEVVQTGNKIDDIFDTPEPYYTRIGSGGLLKVRVKFTYCMMYILLDCVCIFIHVQCKQVPQHFFFFWSIAS